MFSKTDRYKQIYKEDDAPGLDAINDRTKQLYGDQEPVHWATAIPYSLGGSDPLRGVDCFKSEHQEPHLHYVSMGFTNLFYQVEYAEDEISGFGFELTFRYFPVKDDRERPVWPVSLLQNVAKYVFSSGNILDDYHYMSANGPIKMDSPTEITAVAFFIDKEMGEIETAHGRVKFLQMFGITTQEYENILERKYAVEYLLDKHRKTNPLLITDLTRK